MLERVHEEDRVVPIGDVDGFKRPVQKLGAPGQTRARCGDELLGGFDHGEIGVARREHLGDVAHITPHLERLARRQKRVERPHHVASEQRVELVCVLPHTVLVFRVVITCHSVQHQSTTFEVAFAEPFRRASSIFWPAGKC